MEIYDISWKISYPQIFLHFPHILLLLGKKPFCLSIIHVILSINIFLSKCILKSMSIITGCFLPSYLHICWLFQHHLNLPLCSRHVKFYHSGISLHRDIANLSYPHIYPKFWKMPKMLCLFLLMKCDHLIVFKSLNNPKSKDVKSLHADVYNFIISW